MKTLIIFIFLTNIYGCDNQISRNKISNTYNNTDECLTKHNFNIVKDYILKNGEQVKLYKTGLVADTTTLSTQLLLDNKTIALVDYKSDYRIIIIEKSDKEEIPVYFVSNKKNPCEISAYFSLLDTEESIRLRNDDWCKIVTKLKD